jgi:hypothetical protein
MISPYLNYILINCSIFKKLKLFAAQPWSTPTSSIAVLHATKREAERILRADETNEVSYISKVRSSASLPHKPTVICKRNQDSSFELSLVCKLFGNVLCFEGGVILNCSKCFTSEVQRCLTCIFNSE